ncbi:MAG: methyl-accepting chemotaxis protein [Gammaproteobacteria bacterium SHHR-1]|uniref:methyl-accepting chemotaxis protein n=1 Tax=Magnetovirga frankeli TaxID=947516 RepID=UPI001AFBAB50|nr:methyl-accepting chemotaxis protein [gamma proteobacterium SS-5]
MSLNSINAKVMFGYGLILLLFLGSASLLFGLGKDIAGKNAEFVQRQLPELQRLEQASADLNRLHIAAYAYYGTTIEHADYEASYQRLWPRISRALEQSAGHSAFLQQAQPSVRAVKTAANRLKDILHSEGIDWDRAREQLAALQGAMERVQNALDETKEGLAKQAAANAAEVEASLASMQQATLAASLLVLAIIALAFVIARRGIVNPVTRLSAQLNRIGHERDLTQRIEVVSRDELGVAAEGMDGLIQGFHQGMMKIRDSVQVLLDAMGQMENLAAVSEDQLGYFSGHIGQLLDLIGGLEASIQHVAGHSRSASKAAFEGAGQVNQGSQAVKKTAQTIAELSRSIESSSSMLLELRNAGSQIGQVVGTIAEIAEQTNLLALNAAIEAARAGESGRGFAVVADEVRGLATRSHDSTHEINRIVATVVDSISATVEAMEANTNMANQAAEMANATVDSLAQIQSSIQNLSEENASLAGLAEENEKSLETMRSHIEEVRLANSALVDSGRDTISAAKQLSALSDSLNQVVGLYRI